MHDFPAITHVAMTAVAPPTVLRSRAEAKAYVASVCFEHGPPNVACATTRSAPPRSRCSSWPAKLYPPWALQPRYSGSWRRSPSTGSGATAARQTISPVPSSAVSAKGTVTGLRLSRSVTKSQFALRRPGDRGYRIRTPESSGQG